MRRYEPSLIAIAIALAGLGGFVDALGFLSMGGFFVSFMSGNTTRLAVSIGTGMDAPAWRAATLIGAFVVGVMAGTWIANAVPRRRKPAVLLWVTILLFAAAFCHELSADRPALLLIAAAMGAQNGVFQRDGEVSIGLTYMTGTIVRFAQRAALALTGGEKWAWAPYLLLWLGFAGGVLGGTNAYLVMGLDALWIAVVTAALITAIVWKITQPG